MNIPIRIFPLLLCFTLLLCLAGCFQSDSQEITAAASFDIPDTQEGLAALYTQAAEAVLAAENLALQIETQTSITVDSENFTKSAVQTFTCLGQGSDAMRAVMEETLTIGTHTIAIRELYADGNGYFTVNGSHFTSPMTAQGYRARYAPAALMDTALYGELTVQSIDDTTVISFSSPSAAESWAIPEEATLVTASGQAVLSNTGALVGCTYNAVYLYGSASFEQTTAVTIGTASALSIDIPTAADGYLPLDNPDAPRLLEEACGYLTQAQAVSANTTDSITSEAFGIYRTQESLLHMYGSGSDQLALRQTNVELINHSRGQEATHSAQLERFIDGQYTIETNGTPTSDQEQITASKMRTYCQELLVSSILLPEYIVSAATTETDSIYRLDFTASEALAQLMGSNACKTMYDNPQLLNDLASAYQTDSMTAYLEIDKYTGLPVAAGIHYSGTHTIQETAYVLTSQSDQTYTLASQAAYEAIIQEDTVPTEETAAETTAQ